MTNHRFIVLDGLRGIAAIVVLIFHIFQQYNTSELPFAGYAVDFFYVLSGFVIAFAYEEKITSGKIDFSGFAWIRIRRLYPLVFLSTLIGIMFAVVAVYAKQTISLDEVVIAGTLGLLLLPSFVFPQWQTAYPFNMGSWSLTFELFVNALYAIFVKYLNDGVLLLLIFISFLALVYIAYENDGISGGNNQVGFYYGFGRVMFPFFSGVLVYRYRLKQYKSDFLAIGLFLILALVLLMPGSGGMIPSLLCVIVFFPIVVAIGASVSVGDKLATICRQLGDLSYPVYIMQAPLLRVGAEVIQRYHLNIITTVILFVAEFIIVIIISIVALRFYDQPIQKRLPRFLTRSRPTLQGL